MTRRARPELARWLVGLAAVLVGLGGCGGRHGPTHAAYRKAAQARCAEAATGLRGIFQAVDRSEASGNNAATATLMRHAQAVAQDVLDDLSARSVPSADAVRIRTWLRTARAGADTLDQLADAVEQRDDTSIAQLGSRLDTLTASSNAFARSYGMPACAGLEG